MTNEEKIKELEEQIKELEQSISDLKYENDRKTGYVASWKPPETNIFGM